MDRGYTQPRRYEEYAYVLDFVERGKSHTVRGREGIILTALGEDRLTLLEVLGVENSTFEVGERIYIGKQGRTKVQSVLGKLEYAKISNVDSLTYFKRRVFHSKYLKQSESVLA